MNFLKRREAILEILCRKKHVTYQELVWKFGVARGTIRKDVLYLMCSHPIETVRGRYGGVKVMPGFTLHPKRLNKEQLTFLESMKPRVSGGELSILTSIIEQFSP